jgi:uncharacterized membrane-anchored protein
VLSTAIALPFVVLAVALAVRHVRRGGDKKG